MSRTSIRLAAFATIAALGLASAPTFAQNSPPADAGVNERGPRGERGPGGGGPGGMRGGPAGAMLGETFGAAVRPLPRDQAQANDVKPGVGLTVQNVKPDSLAAQGGLKQGDVLVKLGDQWVINPPQLGTLLSIQEVDSSVKLTVRRGGENVELDLKIDQAAHDAMTKALEAGSNEGGPRGGPGGGRGERGGERGERGERGPGGREGGRPPAGGGAPAGGNQ